MFSQLSKKSLASRLIAAPLGLALLAGAALQPVRSDAAMLQFLVPIATLNTLGGLLIVGTPLSALFTSGTEYRYVPLIVGFFGIIALDGEGQQKVVLKPITDEQAHKSGVTAIEQENYNHDLDLIQATFDDITAQIALLPQAEQASMAHELWNKYRSAFAPESFSALEKITTSMAKQKQ